MLTYADVYRRMLTRVSYAAPAQRLEGKQVCVLTYADACFICGHLLTDDGVCNGRS